MRKDGAEETGPEVAILLALYRSGAHLVDQLDSLVAQTHARWSLIVSDDHPTEMSRAMLDAFEAAHPERRVQRRDGPAEGFARNFLSLLVAAPDEADIVALCDHDDVWYPEKLDRAIAALREVPDDVPALYCARTLVCDEQLRPRRPSSLFTRPPDFRNALVQSLGGGNTMALNRAGLELAQAAAQEAGEIVAHDWWLYQIVSGCGGRVIYDTEPVLLYRQHNANAIGANRALKARLWRVLSLLGGRFRGWNRINAAALGRSAHRLTPEARDCLARFAQARTGPWYRRLTALRASGVYRQTRIGSVALWVACLFGRL